MTCFWDGIINGLKPKMNRLEFMAYLKEKNVPVEDVKWQGKLLSKKIQAEFVEAVKDYNVKQAPGGYWCSSCDYNLVLICHLYKINIIHMYNKNIIKYEYAGKTHSGVEYTFESNTAHFWFKSKK